MKKLHTKLSAQTLKTAGLGLFCALGAFTLGLETAGEVHPFGSSEAAVQQEFTETGTWKGDVNGNGRVDPDDAYLLYEISDNLESPTPVQIRRGDTDGDGLLTRRDLGYVLRTLSLQ